MGGGTRRAGCRTVGRPPFKTCSEPRASWDGVAGGPRGCPVSVPTPLRPECQGCASEKAQEEEPTAPAVHGPEGLTAGAGAAERPLRISSLPRPDPEGLPSASAEAVRSRRRRPRVECGGAACSQGATGPLPSKCVAIDCEMVGTGPHGRVSELARCSVVSYHGDVLYDKYIRPEMPVTDYRTRWSGITRQHMLKAIPFREAQKEILKLLKGKVVVGHALHNDFRALKYVHPRGQTRDTTCVPSLLCWPGLHARARVSLKDLALQLLHKKIQMGPHGHSSVEDAMTAMELYRLVEVPWEQQAASSSQPPEDRDPDSSTDMEQYMEDQYWPEDLAQDSRGGTE